VRETALHDECQEIHQICRQIHWMLTAQLALLLAILVKLCAA
jgi:hypothetical protein